MGKSSAINSTVSAQADWHFVLEAPIPKTFLSANAISLPWLSTLKDPIQDHIEALLNQIVRRVTVWPWSDWFSACVAFYDEHFLSITSTFLLIHIPYIWYLCSSEREKVRQCHMIQRSWISRPGPRETQSSWTSVSSWIVGMPRATG